MQLDLVKCFPAGKDGTHKMLPKQRLFFDAVINPKGPKYVGFISGVGGGKTITGCVTMLALAVMYPSTYLIARQYYPELKDTTYRTFREICPKELIVEDRIADMLMRIKGVGGKISTILFRPLEDPDKLRSLNLGGFFIDEASQVSEEAFMLLQGRLRDSGGLRKGITISNPNGHDWQYRWFFKQDHFKNEEEKKKYFLIKGTSLENTFLPEDYISTMLNSWSDLRIQREVMGSFDTFEGAIYDEFRRDVHVVEPYDIPETWTRIIGQDHGYRNAAASVFAAINEDGDIVVYDELYLKETLIEDICKKGLNPKIGKDKISGIYIDPSTKAKRNQAGGVAYSDFSIYLDNLPKSVPLICANNDVGAGIERVKSYLKVDPKTKKPRLTVFSRCHNLLEEFVQYRWDPLTAAQAGTKNDKEQPRKHNDHAMDALRYLVMSRPDPSKVVDRSKAEFPSMEASIRKDFENLRKPKERDPFQDY
jgi:PBSX family phage terminase large subunit